jgi:hypothetical protein
MLFGALMAAVYAVSQRRKQRGEISAETILATLAKPVPSTRDISSQDVLGLWSFYVDAVSSTVTIDLKTDGRYAQAMVSSRGDRIECPGGTWTLAGAYLELTLYRSATRATTETVRWFFGDWEEELVLFARDDTQDGKMLLGRRCL